MAMGYVDCFVLLCVALAGPMAVSGNQFKVGGGNGWSVPAPNGMSYNQWAEKNRFQIGDTLLFAYPNGQDSVLQVDSDAYTKCNTTEYVQKFTDGNTVVTLDHSGPYYFISGNKDNCNRGERMIIVVLADRSGRFALPPTSTPPPPATPPPASAEQTPPPPPPEVPAPAAEEATPPPAPSAASTVKVVAGFVGGVLSVVGALAL